jgi:hypothetical protein
MYFNLNNFNNTVHQLIVIKKANAYLPFANIHYTAYVFVIFCLPGDGYNM